MMASDPMMPLEEQIDRWRSHLRRRQAIHAVDVAELEDHLREQIAGLIDAGLATDEAFLVAVKRIGDLDALSREFAREHAERLWKQLVVPSSDIGEPCAAARTDAVVAVCLAAAAALMVKMPALFGIGLETAPGFYARNLSFFVLPLLLGYFAWKRRLDPGTLRWPALVVLAAAVVANGYPFASGGSTEALTALHLPIVLVLVVGVAYAGGRWREVGGRMDFVRFLGELFIYYVLIALGGGVLLAFMAMIFRSIDIDVEPFFESWLLPCGAAGAVVVASWLVEAKQSVIENMAPVLTRLFTPLFAAVLLAFLGTFLWTGHAIDIERDVLIAFDLLLVLVLGLLLYAVSARDLRQPPGLFDGLQVVLVVSALLADAVALWAIAARITEFGLTPNRVAALGMNLLLLVNLAWSTVLYGRFLRRRGSFADLERWQTDYLPVYALWAAIVVVLFPPAFGYV
ncbi:membrane protein, putative [Rubellimicrobium mesophilum DSM 19309]|uniref:Membrane protein, putative n=1 Tax=Rubellimicrobium mesophilum DSM 19309 TaxID=442562 RepID=A0A017HT01_9RHOB|nr:permease prefix domain 1-containing protein [Rubellimicrobium mesophilum]EYD77293.1 membrane protein, putative [Rubellimicrobium mesophilum DSM 19309]